MAILLTVPLIMQKQDMSCWAASACMVANFRGARLHLEDTEMYKADKGCRQGVGVDTLASWAGFTYLQGFSKRWGSEEMEKALRLWGPLWCLGGFMGGRNGSGHVVVAIGVQEDGQILYNDPAVGDHPLAMDARAFCKLVNRLNYDSDDMYPPVLHNDLTSKYVRGPNMKPLPAIPYRN